MKRPVLVPATRPGAMPEAPASAIPVDEPITAAATLAQPTPTPAAGPAAPQPAAPAAASSATAASLALATAGGVRPAVPRRVPPEKPKLSPAQKFKIWIGRPLVASISLAGFMLVGIPATAATYTRDSPNPLAWRNLSLNEVQGKLDYCLKRSTSQCDYGRVAEAGGLSPRKGRVKRIVILKPYPVAGPVIVDAPAPGLVAATADGAGAEAASRGGGMPASRPALNQGPFPTINFPAGPMSAIEATCEAAKQVAERKGPAYVRSVEMQCEAAKLAYERSHPNG